MSLNRNFGAKRAMLVGGGALLVLAIAALSDFQRVNAASSTAKAAVPAAVSNRTAGFVVSSIDWATGPDADKTSCPAGLTQVTARYQRGGGDSGRAVGLGGASSASRKACEFPNEEGPDPQHKIVQGTDSKVYGLDLDGQDGRANGRAKPGTCAHDDFQGANDEAGIDNQFWRAVGCSQGWQANGGKRLFAQEMLTGAWGILISLKNVDSLVNDSDVRVGIYANSDPIELSAARAPLRFASYNPDQDPRFRGETRGRIVNGILTTDPVNVRFHTITNTMRMERVMDAARLRMKVMPDGSLEGILAGYANVDEMYDFVVGYRKGKDAKGNLAGQRFGSAGGSAVSAGITCHGVYHAMKQLADGERDPKTGACTAISHAYRIKAIPAFVLEKPPVVATAARTR